MHRSDAAPPITDSLSSPSLDELVEPFADRIERLGMVVPAVLLLESCKPLHRLIDHACGLVPASDDVLSHPIARLFREREVCEQLLKRLERGSSAKTSPPHGTSHSGGEGSVQGVSPS